MGQSIKSASRPRRDRWKAHKIGKAGDILKSSNRIRNAVKVGPESDMSPSCDGCDVLNVIRHRCDIPSPTDKGLVEHNHSRRHGKVRVSIAAETVS